MGYSSDVRRKYRAGGTVEHAPRARAASVAAEPSRVAPHDTTRLEGCKDAVPGALGRLLGLCGELGVDCRLDLLDRGLSDRAAVDEEGRRAPDPEPVAVVEVLLDDRGVLARVELRVEPGPVE